MTVGYTSSVTVIVYPQLLCFINPLVQTISYNTTPATLTSTVSGGNGSFTYQWQSSSDNHTWTSGPTTSTYSPGAVTSSKYYRLIVTSNGANDTSSTASITVMSGTGNGIADQLHIDSIPLVNNTVRTDSFTVDGYSLFHTIKNVLALKIVEETNKYIPGDFTADVVCKVVYGHSSNDTTNKIDSIRLNVSYTKNGGNKYNAINYISFSNAEFTRITVMRVDAPTTVNGVSFDTKQVLLLTNNLMATRYYQMADNKKPTITITNPPSNPIPDALPVSWTFPTNTNNNGVQLEWAWLQNEDSVTYKNGSSFDTTLLFKNNSTRIDLSASVSGYNIPLLYGNVGRLFIHARGVNLLPNGSRSDGPWSWASIYAFNGHNDSLNWQVTTTFAEEGKRKTVIQYYDGSLRARQTVTKDNSTNTTVTAETLYDAQGRPSIQILPAPGINNIIAYTKNLNKFNTQSDNSSFLDYFDFTTASLGKYATSPMDTTRGTNLYYSSGNPDNTNVSIKNNIPAGNGFAYAATRYTPDATGRIMRQSGVGDSLQMGGIHTTKYYYGTPAKEELDALFGTEVGNYTHYFKNMVQDANGQMSVSYVDMHGRTIATALAGQSPSSMQALNISDTTQYKNQAGKVMTRNLLDSNTNTLRGNNIESINTILVPSPTLYTFNYNLHKQWLQLPACTGTLTDTCRFDLQIVISDESDSTVATYNYTGIDTINFQNSVVLQAGSYRVRKSLTINQDSLSKFILKYDSLIVINCPTQTFQHLTDSIAQHDSTSTGCAITPITLTCKSCLDSLGKYSNYLINYANSIGITDTTKLTANQKTDIRNQYLSDSSFCIAINTNTSHTLENIKRQMIADMVPFGGQYADSTGSGTMYNKYNIFSTVGGQTYTQPFYKYPMDSLMHSYYYLDPFGKIDSSALSSTLNTMSKNDFEQAFNYSWASSLLPYHPEFNRLKYAQANLQSPFNFIDSVNQTVTTAFAPISSDPYFNTISTSDKPTITKYSDTTWQNNLSMWQIAYGDAFGCKTFVDTTNRKNCYTNMPKQFTITGTVVNTNTPNGNVTLTAAMQSQAWSMYLGLYSSVRGDMVNQYICKHADTTDNYHANIRRNDTLIAQGFKIYFPYNNVQLSNQVPGWTSWYPSANGTYPIISWPDSIKAYTSHCDGYINQWRLSLINCPTLISKVPDSLQREQIIAGITARMDSVCKYGTDGANPYGSSNVAPAYRNRTDTSFEQIVWSVFDTLRGGISRSDLFCNPYAIEFPKPYDKNPVITKQLISGVDTCTCSQWTKLKSEITHAGYDTTSLISIDTYLRNTYNDTISSILFQGLGTCGQPYLDSCHYGPDSCGEIKYPCPHCNTTYIHPLLSAQPLPLFLTCGFNASLLGCYNCTVFKSYDTSFNSVFGHHPQFTGTITNDSTIAYNNLYAQYVNYKTGLQHSWEYYSAQFTSTGCPIGGITGSGSGLSICLNTSVLNDTTGLITPGNPCQVVRNMAETKAGIIYNALQQQQMTSFNAQYIAKCLTAIESFNETDTIEEYHYTLYYYDQAGNLVKTIPPKGVNPIYRQTWIDSVESFKKTGTQLVPSHTYPTRYCYNSLNQVNIQKSPDGGVSKFYYDRLGRLTVSQNAKQNGIGKVYSYTLYDSLGRITEVGQITGDSTMIDAIAKDSMRLRSWFTRNTLLRCQITKTIYDTAYSPIVGLTLTQQNLRNRVSYTQVIDTATNTYPTSATYYSYDVHGNVDTLVQDFGSSNGKINAMNWYNGSQSGNRFKKIVYNYDLISGKVNQVCYQPGQWDAYYHVYSYDAENRLTNVKSGRDSIMLFIFPEQEAQYYYYKHGPLARTILGQLLVQKLDYAYTIQGWLKAINPAMGGTLTNGTDTTEAKPIAQDVYAFSLHYFNKDYRAIGYSASSTTVLGALSTNAATLFNGNIAAMAVNIPQLSATKVYNYHYDQLNRIAAMDMYNGLSPIAGTFTPVSDTSYKERVAYDPNGNILKYLRNGDAGNTMDSLNYKYYASTNQLSQVTDNVLASKYSTDIDNQPANNYSYDAIGNLVNNASDTSKIFWTVYGKVDSVNQNGKPVKYIYDASGNRIWKKTQNDTTVYVRDATGNVLSVYYKPNNSSLIAQTETDLYGSSRLGMATQHMAPDTTIILGTGWGSGNKVIFTRGEKLFELSNHLGNVLATVTDRRIQGSINSDTVNYYKADIATANDFYPFGMLMPARSFTASTDYRYGFNGKEKDKSISSLTAYDYGFRIYSPAIGKFLSLDPLTQKYPYYTPYQFAGNKPIKYIDLDGAEEKKHWYDYDFVDLMNWLGDNENSVVNIGNGKGPIGEKLASFNRNINPVGIAWYNSYQIATGKDFDTKQPAYGGRIGGISNLGVNALMYASGEKFSLLFSPAPELEIELNANKGLIGETNPVSTSNKFTLAERLKANIKVSKISEDIVENRLKAGLSENEILIKKPRFYIGKGDKYAVPDFAIYNTKSEQFVKILDAKNGVADFTKAQRQLNELGGKFRGSSRFPNVRSQEIPKGMLTKEKTNVTF